MYCLHLTHCVHWFVYLVLQEQADHDCAGLLVTLHTAFLASSMHLWLCCCLVLRCFLLQDGVDRTKLGPACAGSLLTATDAGLAGKARRAMPGLSSTVGILSSALTSALLHPEDSGFASFNVNLCGSGKVSQLPSSYQMEAAFAQALKGSRLALRM